MKLRNKLSYIALGGLLMLIGMLASSIFIPSLVAERDRFGHVECTSLTVVGGGDVVVVGKDGKSGVILRVDEYGGRVEVGGKDGKSEAVLGVAKYGGGVTARGKSGTAQAVLGATEYGGLYGRGKGEAIMAINEYGNGIVYTLEKKRL